MLQPVLCYLFISYNFASLQYALPMACNVIRSAVYFFPILGQSYDLSFRSMDLLQKRAGLLTIHGLFYACELNDQKLCWSFLSHF